MGASIAGGYGYMPMRIATGGLYRDALAADPSYYGNLTFPVTAMATIGMGQTISVPIAPIPRPVISWGSNPPTDYAKLTTRNPHGYRARKRRAKDQKK